MPDPSEETAPERAGRRYGRVAAYVLAYALAALPGAFAAVQGRQAASRETVRKVNAESAGQVGQLQEWARASRADLDAVARACEARTEKLRDEVARGQAELTKAILQLATARRVITPAMRERLEAPVKRLPPAAKPAARRLPRLEPPERSLERVEAKKL